jgi:hypothetical protein
VSDGQSEPALSTARTVSRPTWPGSDSGGVDGSSGQSVRTGGLVTWAGGLLDRKGVVEGNRIPCEAVAEREGVLDTEEVFVRFRNGRRVQLVELVDVVRRIGQQGLR